ncbi:MAG: Ig-like domain-containing protein, partial [bacterium]|nr:Ig-like domain-containing protein [bacterium]
MHASTYAQRFSEVVFKFFVSITAVAVVFLSSGSGLFIPQSAQAITVSGTFPATGSTSIPISSFVTVNFSANINPATAVPANVTFVKTSDSSAVPFSIQTFPNGFNVVPSAPPAYTASSRWSKLFTTTSGFYQIPGSGAISVQAAVGGYTSPAIRDIVYFQHGDFPMEVGIVTNDVKTAGTFKVNDFALFGGQQLIKFMTPIAKGLVTSAVTASTGDLIVVNVTENPTDTRYNWHMVTTGEKVNNSLFRLDGALSAPTFVSGSSFGTVTPTDTSAINGSSQVVGSGGGGINLAQGDMLFAKVTAGADNLNSYAWHIVTIAENFSSDVAPSALRLDGAGAAPTFAVSSRISSLTPAAQGAASASSPTFS